MRRQAFNKIINFFLSEAFPLGHGAALSHPDRPSLVWEYTNGLGERVQRSNPDLFIDAIDKMCRAMQCFRKGEMTMDLDAAEGLPETDRKKLMSLIKSIKGEEGEERHQKWLDVIDSGQFSFGAEPLSYQPKGKDSWKF